MAHSSSLIVFADSLAQSDTETRGTASLLRTSLVNGDVLHVDTLDYYLEKSVHL